MKLAVALIGLVLVGCGLPGADGKNGDPGKDGIDNKIMSSISCHGDLSSFSDNQRTLNGKILPGGLYLSYFVTVMNSKDVFVTATLELSSVDISVSRFYSGSQVGSDKGIIVIGLDAISTDNFGYWDLSLDRVTKIMKVKYSDGDFAMAPNYLEFTFPASTCTKDL